MFLRMPSICERTFWQTRGQNREDAARLIRRLNRLKDSILETPFATSDAVCRREQLARYVLPSEICSNLLNLGCTFRQLDEVSERLERLRVESFLGSADIAQAICGCMREIGEYLEEFMVSQLFSRYSLCSINQIIFSFPPQCGWNTYWKHF